VERSIALTLNIWDCSKKWKFVLVSPGLSSSSNGTSTMIKIPKHTPERAEDDGSRSKRLRGSPASSVSSVSMETNGSVTGTPTRQSKRLAAQSPASEDGTKKIKRSWPKEEVSVGFCYEVVQHDSIQTHCTWCN